MILSSFCSFPSGVTGTRAQRGQGAAEPGFCPLSAYFWCDVCLLKTTLSGYVKLDIAADFVSNSLFIHFKAKILNKRPWALDKA